MIIINIFDFSISFLNMIRITFLVFNYLKKSWNIFKLFDLHEYIYIFHQLILIELGLLYENLIYLIFYYLVFSFYLIKIETY